MSQARLERARKIIQDSKSYGILITDSISARYLSGFSSSNIALFITLEKALLITDFRYAEAAEKHCQNSSWKFVKLSKSLGETLVQQIPNNTTILIQSNFMTLDSYNTLQEKLPAVTLKAAGTELAKIFHTKAESEIAASQRAATIADKALELVKKEIEPGISELTLAKRLDELCRQGGSEGPSFDTIVLFGERSALPHGTPSNERLLRAGELILIDFGCTVESFCSDMTRTFSIGTPSDKEVEIFKIVSKAQVAGKAAVKAGVSAKSIDDICRNIIKDAGYGEAFGHGTGHGVGIRIHEGPALNSRDETILEPGMLVTVEPGIYLSGIGGVRMEDLLCVTDNGYISLSQSPRELTI